ncbi:hypothetical protein M6B38_340915 [Iris pallida]|uniref:Uncharacterized protein n=1 Tax=Iris pallida TaxID=29817 RepID=A0AAX6GXR9_IRIPA|nr:hypothetical protein M6B38_340915 [Iris pallida]
MGVHRGSGSPTGRSLRSGRHTAVRFNGGWGVGHAGVVLPDFSRGSGSTALRGRPWRSVDEGHMGHGGAHDTDWSPWSRRQIGPVAGQRDWGLERVGARCRS